MRQQGSRILDMMAHSASRCGRISTKEDRKSKKKNRRVLDDGTCCDMQFSKRKCSSFFHTQERDCQKGPAVLPPCLHAFNMHAPSSKGKSKEEEFRVNLFSLFIHILTLSNIGKNLPLKKKGKISTHKKVKKCSLSSSFLCCR